MKQRSRFAQRLSAFLTTTVMLLGVTAAFPMQKGYAASTVVVDTEQTYQTIKGFGGMNHPEWTGKDLTESQRQTAFGNGENELGMSIVRIYVNDDPNQWYKAVPTAKDVI